jgi:hypothetical protein
VGYPPVFPAVEAVQWEIFARLTLFWGASGTGQSLTIPVFSALF